MAKIVVVDLELCFGCGTCRSLCPKVFGLEGDPRKCLVKDPSGDPSDPECVEFAMSMCPTEAITWQKS
ncbi:MAG: ferredoxin [Deltaproteobacteria bacterium]|nr:ferredoxin [Deltaproteobacteria bacterium]